MCQQELLAEVSDREPRLAISSWKLMELVVDQRR
jgi:hypothetical protein